MAKKKVKRRLLIIKMAFWAIILIVMFLGYVLGSNWLVYVCAAAIMKSRS